MKSVLNILYLLPLAVLLMGQKSDTSKQPVKVLVVTPSSLSAKDSAAIEEMAKGNETVAVTQQLLKSGVADLSLDLATKQELTSTIRVQNAKIISLENRIERIVQEGHKVAFKDTTYLQPVFPVVLTLFKDEKGINRATRDTADVPQYRNVVRNH